MYPSQQHNFPPSSRAPLPHAQNTSQAPTPLHIPPMTPYSSHGRNYSIMNNGIHPMASNGIHPTAAGNIHATGNSISSQTNGNGVPPSPGFASDDETPYQFPDLEPMSRQWGKHGYGLVVQQQPERARMCGFGDKDRRPITPAVIVKLLIFDAVTRQEIDYDRKLEWSKLILHVDLWDVHGRHAENCVKQSESAAAISAATMIAQYPPSQQMSGRHSLSPYPLTSMPAYHRESLGGGRYWPGHNPSFQHQGPVPDNSPSPALAQSPRSQSMGSPISRGTEPHKNLIGQCHTSLQQLNGLDEGPGLFFIFQDLSIRTEGWFRLKCSLFCIGNLGLEGETERATETMPGTNLFKECPCLASTFTKPLKVFSAKKFPGVVDTTQWSAHLAKQGIKIPIRSTDAKKRKRREAGSEAAADEDDDDDE